ncbi:unnamed protein product [Amoebophrya sp. A25]|nr:unnamed protein product [Amoebophrya sp. A25]|eukprot:GSA25T00019885001.1
MAASPLFTQVAEPCGCSPSLLDNNLTSSPTLAAFSSRNKVTFLHPEQCRFFPGPQLGGQIFYLKYLRLFTGEHVLCVGFHGGTQIYSEDGSFLLHLVPLDTSAPNSANGGPGASANISAAMSGGEEDPSAPAVAAEHRMPCHRGACSLSLHQPGRQVLCFGDDVGVVHFCSYLCLQPGGGSFVSNSERIGFGDAAGVTCLETVGRPAGVAESSAPDQSSELLVGYEDGALTWWSVSGLHMDAPLSHEQLHHDSFDDVPVTIQSIIPPDAPSADNAAIATAVAFGSGRVLLYTGARERFAEIAAHGRWITGLAFDPVSRLLASASEDTVLNVYRVDETSGVTMAHSSVVDTKLLTGLTWITPQAPRADGSTQPELAVVAYDSESYQRIKL